MQSGSRKQHPGVLQTSSEVSGARGVRKGQDSWGHQLLFPAKVDTAGGWMERTPWKIPTSIITFFFFFEVEFGTI